MAGHSAHVECLVLSAEGEVWRLGTDGPYTRIRAAGSRHARPKYSPDGSAAAILTPGESQLTLLGTADGVLSSLEFHQPISDFGWSICSRYIAVWCATGTLGVHPVYEGRAVETVRWVSVGKVEVAAVAGHPRGGPSFLLSVRSGEGVIAVLEGGGHEWLQTPPDRRFYYPVSGEGRAILSSTRNGQRPWEPAGLASIDASGTFRTLEPPAEIDPLDYASWGSTWVVLGEWQGGRRLFDSHGRPLTPGHLSVSSFVVRGSAIAFVASEFLRGESAYLLRDDGVIVHLFEIDHRRVAPEIDEIREERSSLAQYWVVRPRLRWGSRAVFYLHGGPYASFSLGYRTLQADWRAVLEAGATVVVCNPIGSRGFPELGTLPLAAWGRRDADAVSDLVDEVGESRNGVVGLSYGALTAARLGETAVFDRLVLSRGLTDPNRMYEEGLLMVADSAASPDRHVLDQLPPAIGRLKGDALLIHGTEDRIVPVQHSVALHVRTPGSRLISVEREGHDLVHWGNSARRAHQVESAAFLTGD